MTLSETFKRSGLLLCLLLVAAASAVGQTYNQKGVVRMITTSATSPITPVAGVKVAVGNNLSKATNSSGQFTMQVPQKFQVNGVAPSDEYILALPTKGQDYFASKNEVPVVVITKKQKETVSKDVYDRLLAGYKKKTQELQSARDEATAKARELKKAGLDYAAVERQRDSLQALLLDYMNNMTNFDEKFDALSEELAITDFQSLSEKEQKVYELKMNGDWEGLSDFYNEIMHGDMKSYLEEGVERERRAAELQRQAEEDKKSRFQDALNQIEALKMQHLNDSVSKCYKILTDAEPGNWKYLNDAGLFECNYMANYAKALDYNNRAIATNPADTLLATSYNNIGVVYDSLGDYDKALEYYEKDLKICLALLGENHPHVATSYNNIGLVYKDMGDYSKALEYNEKSLMIRLSVLGENHPDVAQSYNNIGNVYKDLGDYAKALEYLEKALKILLSVLGENHPNVATSYNNIGNVYAYQDDFVKALEYYEKALKIQLSVLSENHPDAALSYNLIGFVYYSQGDYTMALEFYDNSLKIRLSVLGENHPSVATSYNNIGFVYKNQGAYVKALEYYEKSLNILLSVFGENHPNVAGSYNNIGGVYKDLGDYVKALEYYEKALKIFQNSLPENHPYILKVKKSIEDVKIKLNEQ